MAIARNWNTMTLQIPNLTEEQKLEVAHFIAKLQAQNTQDAKQVAVITGAVLTAMRQAGIDIGAAKPVVTAIKPVENRELDLRGVDEKTAAMVMAIVCAQLGKQPEQLAFRSIKAI